jgi:hypothetical protein
VPGRLARKVTPGFSTFCSISHSQIRLNAPCMRPNPALVLSFKNRQGLRAASALDFGQIRPLKSARHARFGAFHSLNAQVWALDGAITSQTQYVVVYG